MALLENFTRFASANVPSLSLDGRELELVVVAGRYALPTAGRPCSDAPSLLEPRDVPIADEYWGGAGDSSLRYEGQTAPVRAGTDIYVNASAHAAGGRPCERSVVGIRVGQLEHAAVVIGDRYWTEGVAGVRPSRPQPFTTIPLRYERCFGGSPEGASGAVAEAANHNPVGRGLYCSESQAIGRLLANIEHPRSPVSSVRERPRPVGFGPIARHWLPRRTYGGTYDDAWKETRAPLWPHDVDAQLFCAAAPGLVARPHLRGGERVRIAGMHPDGAFEFVLPRPRLQVKFDSRSGTTRRRPVPDGVLFEPDEGTFTVFWRAIVELGRDRFEVERIVVRELEPWEDA